MKNFFTYLMKPITIPLDFIEKYFKVLIFLFIAVAVASSTREEMVFDANVAKITLSGVIMDSEQTLKKIEKAANNDLYKAVVFVVDSPGGSVPPSVEIAEAIKQLRDKKPVVAYAKGTMASGGYYSSIWANNIVANPGSMVGSIGVLLEIGDFSELAKKLGYKPRTITAGKYKAIGDPFREWDEYEREELQKIANNIYELFVTDVAKARGLDLNRKDEFANARIFTAKEAKEQGLIDQIGTMPKVTEIMKKLTKLEEIKYQEIHGDEEMKGFLEQIVTKSLINVLEHYQFNY
jgi:protease-4